MDSSTSFSADKIPKVASKNGISPITSTAVSSPPAKAKPSEYKVCVSFQPPPPSSFSINTVTVPNKETMIPPLSSVERWPARWVANIATYDTTRAKKPKLKSNTVFCCTFRIMLASTLNRMEQK
ncbi:hypothetical protein D3C75_383590 [compost metagenome]